MTFQDLLHMVEAGDTAGVDAWTASGMQETVSADEKLLLTRAAAKAGQAGSARQSAMRAKIRRITGTEPVWWSGSCRRRRGRSRPARWR